MKHIIKVANTFGTEFRIRSVVDKMRDSLNHEDEYLFDMSGIDIISRSAADELYNIVDAFHVEIIRMTPFVQQMYDTVKLGRFQPRQHLNTDVRFVHCTDIDSLSTN